MCWSCADCWDLQQDNTQNEESKSCLINLELSLKFHASPPLCALLYFLLLCHTFPYVVFSVLVWSWLIFFFFNNRSWSYFFIEKICYILSVCSILKSHFTVYFINCAIIVLQNCLPVYSTFNWINILFDSYFLYYLSKLFLMFCLWWHPGSGF